MSIAAFQFIGTAVVLPVALVLAPVVVKRGRRVIGCATASSPIDLKMKSLRGKHVVITGGSSGIGLACAIQSAKEGAHVTLIARDAKKLERAKAAVVGAGDLHPDGSEAELTVDTKACDVASSDSITKAIRAIFAVRPIDVLVCNAGIVRTGYFEDSGSEDIEAQVKTNLMGTIYPIHAALPLMKARSSQSPGSIVMMSSLSGLGFWYGAAVYTATKYAQRGLAEALRVELLPYNIKLSVVCPNFTDTPFIDDAEAAGSELNQMMKIACAYDRTKLESPDHIAQCTVKAVKNGTFLVTTQMPLGGIFQVLSRGFFPPDTWLGCVAEVLAASPLRFLSILGSKGLTRRLKKEHEDIHKKSM